MDNRDPKDPLLKRARRLTLMASSRLYWERYAPGAAIGALAASLFMIAGFSGLWERLGDPWRAIAALTVSGILVRTVLKLRKIKRPTLSEARRRVERDSGAKHRPLDTLDDHPAFAQTDSSLWPMHYEQARRAAQKLDPPLPRAVIAPMDPYFLRWALPALLGLSLFIGAGDNLERLRRALWPVWQSPISAKNLTFEAWVDPPDYTGRPPIYFKDQTSLDIPAGSELVARISGSSGATRLKLKGRSGTRYLPLSQLGPKSFETRAIINEDKTARWRVGSLEKAWDLTAVPDRAPTVDFKINPRADKRDRLAFTYSFTDDYGVTSLILDMRLLTEDPGLAEDRAKVRVPLAGKSVMEADFAKAALDLTQHRWAGKKVAARLIAEDGIGQTAQTDEVYFTVPNKIFIEPLAKAVAEQRSLVLAGQIDYAPLPRRTAKYWAKYPWFDTYEPEERLGRAAPSIQRAADLIEAVTDLPQGLYEDPAVFLGLKHVLGRLRYAHDLSGLNGIPEDLWSIAMRAEFGILGTALEEMREAQEALRDGIARRAPQREIDTLFERYNEAVDRYMDELRRKAMEEGNISQAENTSPADQRNISEIQALMDAIEEANRIGDTEGARRGLEKLAELLENMQIQLSASGGGGDGPPFEGEMSEEMKKSLEEMADLLGEQRELKDETEQSQRAEQNGTSESQSGSGAASPGELAARQDTLKKSLDALSEGLPEDEGTRGGGELDESGNSGAGGEDNAEEATGQSPAEALADAKRAMQESEEALSQGDLGRAAQAQAKAIASLRDAGKGLAKQAAGERKDANQGTDGQGSDPLGRENTGENDDQSGADIDNRDNATRSRELLEELRRRAAEQEREKQEREYLERLLKRF